MFLIDWESRPCPSVEDPVPVLKMCERTEGDLEIPLFLIMFVFVWLMVSREIQTFFPFDYLDLKISNQRHCYSCLFETGCPVAQANLKLIMWLRLTLNSWSPCFHFPNAGAADMCHHPWLNVYFSFIKIHPLLLVVSSQYCSSPSSFLTLSALPPSSQLWIDYPSFAAGARVLLFQTAAKFLPCKDPHNHF